MAHLWAVVVPTAVALPVFFLYLQLYFGRCTAYVAPDVFVELLFSIPLLVPSVFEPPVSFMPVLAPPVVAMPV